MKLTVFLTLGLVTISLVHKSRASNTANEGRFSPNSVINQLFEMFRGLIINGDVEKNIPKSDPYVFDIDRLSFMGYVRGELNVTNGILVGLGSFSLETFTFSKQDLSVDISVIIPKLKLEADFYEMQGNMLDAFPLAGSGIVYAIAKDITLHTKVCLKQSDSGNSVIIDRLENTKFTIGKIVSLTEFDKNIDAIANAVIENFLASYLSRFSKYLAASYQDHLLAAVNPMLAVYDTWNTLATIL